MSGLLYQLREDYPDRLRLVRANSTHNFSTALHFGVRAAPTVIAFHAGRQVGRWNGRINIDELYDLLDGLMERTGEAAG